MTTLSPKTLAAIEKGPRVGKLEGIGTAVYWVEGETPEEFATRIALIEREEVARECARLIHLEPYAEAAVEAILARFVK